MAASGIAEHNEARRRENGYLRKAYLQSATQRDPRSIKVAQNQAELRTGKRMEHCQHSHSMPSSYDLEIQRLQSMGKLEVKHDAESVDRERRLAYYKQMQTQYSAKLPNRYTSIDYVGQW